MAMTNKNWSRHICETVVCEGIQKQLNIMDVHLAL